MINNLHITDKMYDVIKPKLDRKTRLTGYPSIDRPHEKNASFLEKHPIIPNLSIYNTILAMNLNRSNEEAVECLDLTATYQELFDDAKALSKGFKELGVKKGDIVSCTMPNLYQAIVTFFAANRIGAVTSFLNLGAGKEEIKEYLNEFESPIFVNYNETKEYNDEIIKDTHVKNIITLKESDSNKKGFSGKDKILGNTNQIDYVDMKSIGNYYKGFVNAMHFKDDDALILFTSGTTGKPKSVLLSNENFLASCFYIKNTTEVPVVSKEKCLVCVPFCYPYGIAASALMSLICGRKIILSPNLSAQNVSALFEKKPNIIFGSPAMLEMIKRNVKPDQDLSSVHSFISGGDFLTPQGALDGINFFKKHGATVEMCNGSGNAETSASGTTAYGLPKKPETVGKLLVGSDAIVINMDTGEECRYGETGVLCVGGKHVFKGYYKKPALTQKSFITFKGKKYFNTETMGFIDEDGYFTLTGRQARFYIRSTLNKVYLDNIQNIISKIKGVENCAVVKVPDEEYLYTSKAYIVLTEDLDLDEEYIYEALKKPIVINEKGDTTEIKDYEMPSSIEFVDELPRTKADKIDYNALEQMALQNHNKTLVKKRGE